MPTLQCTFKNIAHLITNFEKLLIFGDDPDILDLVQYVLKKAGFEVHIYNSGFGAGVKITRCNPNAILLDIQLPGRSGKNDKN